MEEIILLGIGGHAHSVVDSIEKDGKYRIAGFIDTINKQKEHYKCYEVIGTDNDLKKIYNKGIRNAFITVGYLGEGTIRNRLYEILTSIGFYVPPIIDPSAQVATNVKIGQGVFAGKNVVVNSNSIVSNMCILNTGAIIEHDCIVGEFSHVAVGTVICGNVSIGKECMIGANSTIIQGVSVGNHTIIGAGTVVTHDVKDNMIKYGNIEKNR